MMVEAIEIIHRIWSSAPPYHIQGKPDQAIPDDAVTVDKCLEWIVVAGSPGLVLERLEALVDEIGWFGTLLLTHKDWDQPELHRRSMRLFAEQVMPRFRQYMEARQKAAQ